MSYQEDIWRFEARNVQEEADQRQILAFIRRDADGVLQREHPAHITASALVFNPAKTKVLLVFHNQFRAWSWTGGHADGQADLFREVEPLSPAIQSLDILPVWGHEKQGRYVTAHLHLSVGYALTAPENQLLAAKTDENSGVRWVSVRQLEQYVTEPYMLYIYRKIGARLGAF
mgnify:CR=1 FL=1